MKKSRGNTGFFSTIKTNKIPDEVYRQIVSMISGGDLRPGDRLPSERQMASLLGVSRQSVREALYRAETMGLIEVRQGEGSFVLSSVGESLKPPLRVLLEEEAERIFEFLEIRKLIEGWCAEKAAAQASPEDLGRMWEILVRMREISLTDREWEKADVAFHLCVAAAAHNVIAMHVMEALRDSFDDFFRFRKVITRPEKKELLWQHHNEIFEAIQRGAPALARQKIVDHLDFIGKKIREDMQRIKG